MFWASVESCRQAQHACPISTFWPHGVQSRERVASTVHTQWGYLACFHLSLCKVIALLVCQCGAANNFQFFVVGLVQLEA